MDSNLTTGIDIAVNGRRYRTRAEPVVVVCIDGSEPGYIFAPLVPMAFTGSSRGRLFWP